MPPDCRLPTIGMPDHFPWDCMAEVVLADVQDRQHPTAAAEGVPGSGISRRPRQSPSPNQVEAHQFLPLNGVTSDLNYVVNLLKTLEMGKLKLILKEVLLGK